MSKSALVVGAAGGIGTAVTEKLVSDGWNVTGTVIGAGEGDTLKQAVPKVSRVAIVDLGKLDHLAGSLAPLVETLDAVVVCAAIAPVGPLETMPLARVRQTLDINTLAAVGIYQACMPALRRSKGRMVLTSSFSGKVALPFVGAYSGSKFALEGFADVMRREAAGFGVSVSLVEPGGVATPMVKAQVDDTERAFAALSPEMQKLYGGLFETYGKVFRQALSVGLKPSDVADLVAGILASSEPQARYVIGEDAKFMCQTVAAMPDQQADATLAGFLAQFAHASGGVQEE